MSKYTTETRFVCEDIAHRYFPNDRAVDGFDSIDEILDKSWDKIFTTHARIFDENYREHICKKILKHYYVREIGAETVGLWKYYLNRTFEENLPYYNELWKSTFLDFPIFSNVDVHTIIDGNSRMNVDTVNEGTKQEVWSGGDVTTKVGDKGSTDDIQKEGTKNTDTGVDTSGTKVYNKVDDIGSVKEHETVVSELGEKHSNDELNKVIDNTSHDNTKKDSYDYTEDTNVHTTQKDTTHTEEDKQNDVHNMTDVNSIVDKEKKTTTEYGKGEETSGTDTDTTTYGKGTTNNNTRTTWEEKINSGNEDTASWNLYSDTPQGSISHMNLDIDTTVNEKGALTNPEATNSDGTNSAIYLTNATKEVGNRQAGNDETTDGWRNDYERQTTDGEDVTTKEKGTRVEYDGSDTVTENGKDSTRSKTKEDTDNHTFTETDVTKQTDYTDNDITEDTYEESSHSNHDENTQETDTDKYQENTQKDSDTTYHEDYNEHDNEDYDEKTTGRSDTDYDEKWDENDNEQYNEAWTEKDNQDYGKHIDTDTLNTGNSLSVGQTSDRQHEFGKRGNLTFAQMLTEFRDTLLNVDMQFINEFESCFMQLW